MCMPQLHLYVPEEVAAIVRRRAEAEGLTLSRYLALLVEREAAPGWPPAYFERVAGGWKGALERPPQGKLERRSAF